MRRRMTTQEMRTMHGPLAIKGDLVGVGARNFKSIHSAEIGVAPLTVVVGENSSGKSSLFQVLLGLVQSKEIDSPKFLLNGRYTKLGDYKGLLHNSPNHDAAPFIELSFFVNSRRIIRERFRPDFRERPPQRPKAEEKEEVLDLKIQIRINSPADVSDSAPDISSIKYLWKVTNDSNRDQDLGTPETDWSSLELKDIREMPEVRGPRLQATCLVDRMNDAFSSEGSFESAREEFQIAFSTDGPFVRESAVRVVSTRLDRLVGGWWDWAHNELKLENDADTRSGDSSSKAQEASVSRKRSNYRFADDVAELLTVEDAERTWTHPLWRRYEYGGVQRIPPQMSGPMLQALGVQIDDDDVLSDPEVDEDRDLSVLADRLSDSRQRIIVSLFRLLEMSPLDPAEKTAKQEELMKANLGLILDGEDGLPPSIDEWFDLTEEAELTDQALENAVESLLRERDNYTNLLQAHKLAESSARLAAQKARWLRTPVGLLKYLHADRCGWDESQYEKRFAQWETSIESLDFERFKERLESRLAANEAEWIGESVFEEATERLGSDALWAIDAASEVSNSIAYLGPLRVPPSNLYEVRRGQLEIGNSGEYFVGVLEANQDKRVLLPSQSPQDRPRRGPLLQAVNEELTQLAFKTTLQPRDVGSYGVSVPLSSKVTEADLDLTKIGVGLSQVTPVIMKCLLADPGETVILEQPELHLHPKAEQLLADFFIRCANSGRQILVETHSEHLVNRLRYRVAEDDSGFTGDMVSLLFAEQKEEEPGVTTYRESAISDTGGLDADWPAGFLDLSAKESQRLVQEALKRRLANRDS